MDTLATLRQKYGLPIVDNSETENETDIEVPAGTADHPIPTADCLCGGGSKYGHYNEAGGICCPHKGNTCGYHGDAKAW